MKAQSSYLWDIPTRIIHWVIATAVVLNLFFLEEGEEAHQWSGYIAVAFVFLRLVWGFIGARPSRLRSFPVHPKSVFLYLKNKGAEGDLYRSKHNPLASLVYLAIWGLILGLGITGYMMDLDQFWGEEWLEELHGYLSDGLMVLLGVHLIGLLIDSIRYRRHTWLAMLHGRR